MTQAAKKKAGSKPCKAGVPRLVALPPHISLDSVNAIADAFKRESAEWIKKYNEGSAYQAFCLDLHTPLDMGMGEFLSNSLTDGPRDHKIDFCHIDGARALVVQGYHSDNWGKLHAPANKASDLITAVGSLLSSETSSLSTLLQEKAMDLQRAIKGGEIARVDLCYVHNCHESESVSNSLYNVEEIAKSRIQKFRPPRDIGVRGYEIGLETVSKLLQERNMPLLIDEMVNIPRMRTGIIKEENQESGWRAVVLSVPANWVRELHKKWGNFLFVANVRDFLGASDARGKINAAIRQTAEKDPGNFWVFNNGITALTKKIIDIQEDHIVIEGISVVNGAQTTGALGGASQGDIFSKANPDVACVLLRIIETRVSNEKNTLIGDITSCNNTQNRLYPEDTRSKCPRQIRLREEFEKFGVPYVHRRNQDRAQAGTIQLNVVARLLCAFHGDPETSLRSYRKIFSEDAQYNAIFPTGLCAAHVFLLDTLSEALDEVKRGLKDRATSGIATSNEKKRMHLLAHSSAAKHFFLFVVGESAEEILGREISNKHRWGTRNIGLQERREYVQAWMSVVKLMLGPLPQYIEDVGDEHKILNSFYIIPRSKKYAKQVAKLMGVYIEREDSASALKKIRGLSTIVG